MPLDFSKAIKSVEGQINAYINKGQIPPRASLSYYLDLKQAGSSGGSAVGAGDASAANQAVEIIKLDAILAELRDDIHLSETVWYDRLTPTLFYVRRSIVEQDTNVITTSFYDAAGIAATPVVGNLVQAVSNTDFEFNSTNRKAIVAGSGYSINDCIQELQILNMSLGTLVNTIWINKTTDLLISAPNPAHLVIDDSYANKANQALQIAEAQLLNLSLGQKADTAATTDTGVFSLISFVKRGLTNWTTLLGKFKSVVPVATDSGLVTRNIPSGIQQVKLNEVTETVIEGTENGVYVAQKTIRWYDSVSQALIQTTFEYVDKDGNIVATPTNFIPTVATSTKSLQEAQLSTLDNILVKNSEIQDTLLNESINVNVLNSPTLSGVEDLKSLIENGNNLGTEFCKLIPKAGHKTYTIAYTKTGLAGSVGVFNRIDGIEYQYGEIFDLSTGKRIGGDSIGQSGHYIVNISGVDEVYLKTTSFFSANINASAKLSQTQYNNTAFILDQSNNPSFLEKDNGGNLKVSQPSMFSIEAGGDNSSGNTPFGAISLSGQNTVSFRVSGTWVATLKPLLFIAGGDVTPRIYDIATGNEILGGITTNGTYAIQTYGATSCSFVANPFTSGQVDVGYISTPASFEFKIASSGSSTGLTDTQLRATPVSQNLVQVGGTAITLGQKVSASSLPVTISSDQTNLPSNITQVNGVAIALNNGITSTGTQRVVLANRTETQVGSIGTSSDIAPTAGQRIKTLTFTNNTAAVIFVQIHNKATALALNDIPLNGLIFRVPANSTLDKTVADFGETGTLYGANTRIGLSSTFGTYTAIAPANTSINVITVV